MLPQFCSSSSVFWMRFFILMLIAGRRIKVDTAEFKKIVNAFSKISPEDRKNAFVKAAELVVGGRAKAKPFGLAGLQYIESKIK